MKKAWAVVSAVAAVVSLGLPVMATGPDPIALYGPVPDAASGVEVVVLPDLDRVEAGQTASSYTLPNVTVVLTESGYAAYVDPSSIPDSYIGDGGLVDFQVVASNATTSWTTSTTSRITKFVGDSDSEAFWADPGANSDLLLERSEATRRIDSSRFGLLAKGPLARVDETEVEDDGTRSWNSFSVDDGYDARSGCSLMNTGEKTVRQVTIGTSYPVGAVKGRMSVSSTSGAKYGVAVSVDGGGGFSAAGSKFTQSGFGFIWAWEGAARAFRKSVEYTKFRITCGVPGAVVYKTSWRPTGETGGVGNNYGIAVPNWTNCFAAPKGIWYRGSQAGSAYSYGSAVKFANLIGIDLGISREYDFSQKLEYDIPDGTSYKVCGSNANPNVASKVQVKRR